MNNKDHYSGPKHQEPNYFSTDSKDQLKILQRTVEQSSNSIMITNKEGVIEYVNPKFTELTGYSSAEVVGQNPRILKSGKTSQQTYQALWGHIQKGETWEGEIHNRKKNGELYWETTTITPIRNEQGEISHFLSIKEDITEKLRLQAEVISREKKIAENHHLATIGRMAAMISHDLRNPLSSVKMGLQMLHADAVDESDERSQELAEISLEQVRYMETLLCDILAFSSPGALKLEWFDINKVIDTTLSSLQKQIAAHRAIVETDYQTGLPTLHGDSSRLRQVLSNLITNALQSCEEFDRNQTNICIIIALSLSNTGPCVEIQIIDNGPGFDQSKSNKLFQPFYTTRAKGTGLGLPIVASIMEQHGGTFDLNPGPNGGAIATLRLPTGPHYEQPENTLKELQFNHLDKDQLDG